MSERKNSDSQTLILHDGQEIDGAIGLRVAPIYEAVAETLHQAEFAAGLFTLLEFRNIYTYLMNPAANSFERRIEENSTGLWSLILNKRKGYKEKI